MDIFHDFCHQALDTMFQNFFYKEMVHFFSSTFQNSFTVPHHGWGLKSFKNTAK